LIYSWASYEPLESGGYTYPDWANAIGWLLAAAAILPVPIVALYTLGKFFLVDARGRSRREVRKEKNDLDTTRVRGRN